MKRTVSLLLALALMLGLTACGSAGETVIAPGAEDGGWTGRGGPFALRKVELSGEALQLTGGGDAAYVLTSDGGFRLLCLEGGETRELAYTSADGSPSRMAGDESGVWLVLCDALGEDYRLVHYPRDGSAPDASADIDILNCVELEYSAGEFYIYDYNAGLLRVLGADGSETAQIDPGKRTVTGLAATDGGVYVGLAAEDGERTLAFCTEGGLSDERQLTFSVRRAGGEGGCLLTDDEGLWRLSGGEPEPVAIWSECGITLADLTALVPLGEGYALINGGALYLLEPAEPGDIVPRREVSVYSLDPATDSMLDEVLARINTAELGLYAYTVHDAEADAQARLRTLAELFASGAGPELVSFGGMNPVSVTGSGWFCDIYELIDADAEFERSDLVAASAYERDGRLYAIPAAFGVSTLLGRESRFGQRFEDTRAARARPSACRQPPACRGRPHRQPGVWHRGWWNRHRPAHASRPRCGEMPARPPGKALRRLPRPAHSRAPLRCARRGPAVAALSQPSTPPRGKRPGCPPAAGRTPAPPVPPAGRCAFPARRCGLPPAHRCSRCPPHWPDGGRSGSLFSFPPGCGWLS